MYVRRIREAGNLAITGLLNVLLHQRPLLILRVINNSSTGVDPKVSVFCFPAWVESSILSSTSYYTSAGCGIVYVGYEVGYIFCQAFSA